MSENLTAVQERKLVAKFCQYVIALPRGRVSNGAKWTHGPKQISQYRFLSPWQPCRCGEIGRRLRP